METLKFDLTKKYGAFRGFTDDPTFTKRANTCVMIREK